MKRFSYRFDAIDSRQVENILMTHADAHPPRKHTWLKTRDPLWHAHGASDVPLIGATLAIQGDAIQLAVLAHGVDALTVKGRRAIR